MKEAWRRAEGGILTGVASKQHFRNPVIGEDEFSQSYRRIIELVDCFCLSCDLMATGELQYRTHFECDSVEKANELKKLVATLLSLLPQADESDEPYNPAIYPLMGAVTTVRENPNGSCTVIMTNSQSDPLRIIMAMLQ